MENRPIKFRARAIKEYQTNTCIVDTGDWVYGHYYFCFFRETGIIVTRLEAESGGIDNGLAICEIEVDNKTVTQFTGKYDKNGTEIYEGDILQENYGDAEGIIEDITDVKWLIMDGFLAGHFDDKIDGEVIGNIYQNEDLIQ